MWSSGKNSIVRISVVAAQAVVGVAVVGRLRVRERACIYHQKFHEQVGPENKAPGLSIKDLGLGV